MFLTSVKRGGPGLPHNNLLRTGMCSPVPDVGLQTGLAVLGFLCAGERNTAESDVATQEYALSGAILPCCACFLTDPV